MQSSDEGEKGQAIPHAERLAVMRRLEEGETAVTIAREYGVSRQYVSLLKKLYQEGGEEALVGDRRGRRATRRLTLEEKRELLRLVDAGFPSKYGLVGTVICEELEFWTVEALRTLAQQTFGFLPNRGDAKTVLLGRGFPVSTGLEQQCQTSTPGTRTRQRKLENPRVGPGGEIDVSEVDEEELARIRSRIEAGERVLPSFPTGPGVRIGKNRGSKAKQRKKRRK